MKPDLARAIYDRLLPGWRVARLISGNRSVRCPLHADSRPSFHLHEVKLVWICRAGCGSGGAWGLAVRLLGERGAHDLVRQLDTNAEAPSEIGTNRNPSSTGHQVEAAAIYSWTVEVIGPPTSDQIDALRRSRRLKDGCSLDAIGAKLVRARFSLSAATATGEEWLAFPALNRGWKLWAVDSCGRPRRDQDGRLVRRNAGSASILVSPALLEASDVSRLLDVEGESDFLAAIEAGFPHVITGTTGAASLSGHDAHADWLAAKQPHEVVIVGDLDASGGHGAAARAAKWLGWGIPVRILRLPQALGAKGDLRDYLNGRPAQGVRAAVAPLGDADALASLIEATPLQRPPRGGLDLVRLDALLAEPDEPVRWLVEELLPQGGLSVLAGKPKAGKSTLARDLALAVAQGRPFIGRPVAPSPVVYLALEEKRSEVKRHLAIMGARPEDPIHFLFGQAPKDVLQRLAHTAREVAPGLIIVDTLARIARVRDMNDYAEVMSALEPLLAIARESGAHVLLVHHAKKGEGGGGDSILGSTAIFGTVDTALILRRNEDRRLLSSIQRYGSDLPDTVVTLDPETFSTAVVGTRSDLEIAEMGERIIAFLREHGPVAEKEIREAVEGRNNLKPRALRAVLSPAGPVFRSGTGKRNDPYLYHLPDARTQVPIGTPGTGVRESVELAQDEEIPTLNSGASRTHVAPDPDPGYENHAYEEGEL